LLPPIAVYAGPSSAVWVVEDAAHTFHCVVRAFGGWPLRYPYVGSPATLQPLRAPDSVRILDLICAPPLLTTQGLTTA
jgi:hypothetical protein